MSDSRAPSQPPAPRRRYAIVGVGSRHRLYREAIETTYADRAELVALCDNNAGRIAIAQRDAVRRGVKPPQGFGAADFGRMLAECRPGTVIVTTPDATHHDYAIRAMDAGCDVIMEKPMATDADQCRRLLDARRRTGRRCRVTFNYRYSPPRSQVKDLLLRGEIGEVLSVDFHWLLNTHHGADYFRRWHSAKKNSGGLFVHKATHHFDLVNWWLGALPVSVQASGKREFYTPATARRLGLSGPHERCSTCPEAARCDFRLDLRADASLRELYLEQEAHDGYLRDRCVFRTDIDIEDTMNALVTYDTGATLSYSLNAFNAWEGYTVAFNGTAGRLEHTLVESTYVRGVETAPLPDGQARAFTRVIPLRGAARELEPWTAPGSHGGGDRLMLEDLFAETPPSDPLGRAADERAGACSILVGIGANRSLASGARINLADLIGPLPASDPAPRAVRHEGVTPHLAAR